MADANPMRAEREADFDARDALLAVIGACNAQPSAMLLPPML